MARAKKKATRKYNPSQPSIGAVLVKTQGLTGAQVAQEAFVASQRLLQKDYASSRYYGSPQPNPKTGLIDQWGGYFPGLPDRGRGNAAANARERRSMGLGPIGFLPGREGVAVGRAKKVPGSIHNYPYQDLEPSAARGRQIVGGGRTMLGKAGPSGFSQYGAGYVAPKRTMADTGVRYPTTPAARPVAKKKVIAPTPAAQRSRQIAR